MKKFFIILIVLCLVSSIISTTFSQQWLKLPNSEIKFSNFQADSSIKWKDYSFEYFLKGGKLLSIAKGLSDEFKDLLITTPRIFDDLFKCAYNITKKEDLNWKAESFGGRLLDTLIIDVPFESAMVISSRNYYIGVNESIWILSNPPATNELGGWFLKMVFRIKGKKLKYLISEKDHIVY